MRPRPEAGATTAIRSLWAIFGLALIAGLVFRLAVIDESFWYDEAVSASRYFGHSPVDILTADHPNNHPLYSLAVRVIWEVFGESELTARLPALLAWGAILAMLVWLGRRLVSARVGWLAAILGVVAYWQIRYSVEARGNELAAAIGLAAIGVLVVALEGRRRRRLLLGSAALLALAAFAHLYAATLTAGALAVWAASRVRSRADLRAELPMMIGWAAVFGAVLVVLYLPAQNLIKVAGSLILRGEAPGSGSLTERMTISGDYLLEVSRGFLTGVPTLLGAALLVVPYGLGLWSVRRHPVALAVLGIPVVVLVAAVATTFLFFERFLIVLQPYALLGVAAGIDHAMTGLVRLRNTPAAVAGAALALAMALIPPGGFPEALPMQVRGWDEAAAYIDANGPALVVANPVLEGWSPVRDTLGYYLEESTIVEPAEVGLNEGTELYYVRRGNGAPEGDLRVQLGPPVEFGEIQVYRVVWRDGGLEPAG